MDDQDKTRRIARESLARGDALGWFDEVYRQSNENAAEIPWADLAPNRNLLAWLDREQVRGDGREALVVGCGLGDDAEELARRGFRVTAFDISPTAIDWCARRFPQSPVEYVRANLLAPPVDWRERFDFAVEIYTLQALPLAQRLSAVGSLSTLLAPGGKLLIVCRGRDDDDPEGELPWYLPPSQLAEFERHGLRLASFDDFIDTETPPKRRFRAVYVCESQSASLP